MPRQVCQIACHDVCILLLLELGELFKPLAVTGCGGCTITILLLCMLQSAIQFCTIPIKPRLVAPLSLPIGAARVQYLVPSVGC
jgi:hypothetical protein